MMRFEHTLTREELSAVLFAWCKVQQHTWPDLIKSVPARVTLWPKMSVRELRAELNYFLVKSEKTRVPLRVYWKLGIELQFAGCNTLFALDANSEEPKKLLGKTDFDTSIPWNRQAAKYQRDEHLLMHTPELVRDMAERQDQTDKTVWLHSAKTTLRLVTGEIVGIFGMYQVIDRAIATQLTQSTQWPMVSRTV